MAKSEKEKLVSCIGGFNGGLQSSAAAAHKKTQSRIDKEAKAADKAAKEEQKKVDAKRKQRDAAKKKQRTAAQALLAPLV